MKKRVIVYGLGEDYKKTKVIIEDKFEVIGRCDSMIMDGGVMRPEDIPSQKFDYICITSSKYFQEIKDRVINLIGTENEYKILSLYDVIGDFRNSEVRDQWVIDKLSEIQDGKILLDAGAGEQKYKPYCSHLKYIAQDFGKYIPNEVDTGFQTGAWDYTGLNLICDIVDMPLDDSSVDVILCTEVFEHLKDPIAALREFYRVLKSGGILILTAPFCCLTHMAPYFYYNGFSEYWYKEHLGDNRFIIKEFTRSGNFFKYLCQELFRVEDVAKRYCESGLESHEVNLLSQCIDMLMRISERDNGSDELLCFGNMLVAEKTE